MGSCCHFRIHAPSMRRAYTPPESLHISLTPISLGQVSQFPSGPAGLECVGVRACIACRRARHEGESCRFGIPGVSRPRGPRRRPDCRFPRRDSRMSAAVPFVASMCVETVASRVSHVILCRSPSAFWLEEAFVRLALPVIPIGDCAVSLSCARHAAGTGFERRSRGRGVSDHCSGTRGSSGNDICSTGSRPASGLR